MKLKFKIALYASLGLTQASACPDLSSFYTKLIGTFKGHGHSVNFFTKKKRRVEAISVALKIPRGLTLKTITRYYDDSNQVVKRHKASYKIIEKDKLCSDSRLNFMVVPKKNKAFSATFDGDTLVSFQDLGNNYSYTMTTEVAHQHMLNTGHFAQGEHLIEELVIQYEKQD